MTEKQEIEPMLTLLKNNLNVIAGDNFNYIQLYFERLLSVFTLNNDLWIIYINYMEEKCSKKEARLEFYQRAIKNCSYNHEFWLGYMRELEKNETPSQDI